MTELSFFWKNYYIYQKTRCKRQELIKFKNCSEVSLEKLCIKYPCKTFKLTYIEYFQSLVKAAITNNV